jgi:ribosome-associated protein
MHDDDHATLPEGPSKSQRKRDMHRLQQLGEQLADLTPEQWERLPLDDGLREALAELRRIHSREARRRQLQYLGRLMRDADGEAIAAALERLQQTSLAAVRHLHRLEYWRDRLLAEGDPAVTELLTEHPQLVAQTLRQLTRNAQRERVREQPPAAARKLFRYLRDTLDPD